MFSRISSRSLFRWLLKVGKQRTAIDEKVDANVSPGGWISGRFTDNKGRKEGDDHGVSSSCIALGSIRPARMWLFSHQMSHLTPMKVRNPEWVWTSTSALNPCSPFNVLQKRPQGPLDAASFWSILSKNRSWIPTRVRHRNHIKWRKKNGYHEGRRIQKDGHSPAARRKPVLQFVGFFLFAIFSSPSVAVGS